MVYNSTSPFNVQAFLTLDENNFQVQKSYFILIFGYWTFFSYLVLQVVKLHSCCLIPIYFLQGDTRFFNQF